MKKIILAFILILPIFVIDTYAASTASEKLAQVPKEVRETLKDANGNILASGVSVGGAFEGKNPAGDIIKITTQADNTRVYENVTKGTRVSCDGESCTGNDSTWATSIESSSTEYSRVDGSGGPIEVYTTEEIPGASCTCVSTSGGNNISARGVSCGDITTRKYKCIVQPGLGSFQEVFASIIRYFVNIVLLLGVLAIVGLGIAWTWAGGEDIKAKSMLKSWGTNIMVGLVILFLFQYILKFLAPWIYK